MTAHPVKLIGIEIVLAQDRDADLAEPCDRARTRRRPPRWRKSQAAPARFSGDEAAAASSPKPELPLDMQLAPTGDPASWRLDNWIVTGAYQGCQRARKGDFGCRIVDRFIAGIYWVKNGSTESAGHRSPRVK